MQHRKQNLDTNGVPGDSQSLKNMTPVKEAFLNNE